MQKIENERLYSVKEIAEMQLSVFLDSKRKIIYLCIDRGIIPYFRPTGSKKGKIGIYGKDILEFLKSNK